MRLKDKIALITGGGSGIGAAVARQLLDLGHRVAVTGRGEARLRGFAADMKCGFSETGRVAQWGQIEQNLDQLFTKAIYGKITPPEALAQGASQAKSTIASGGG